MLSGGVNGGEKHFKSKQELFEFLNIYRARCDSVSPKYPPIRSLKCASAKPYLIEVAFDFKVKWCLKFFSGYQPSFVLLRRLASGCSMVAENSTHLSTSSTLVESEQLF